MARGNKKYTIQEVRRIFADNGCELLTDEYVNAKGKLTYICECGNESTISFTNFLSGQRCWKCRNKKIAESKKVYSFEYVKQVFRDNGCTLLEMDYINTVTPMRYICNCGNPSEISFEHFKSGHRCKECGYKKASEKLRHDYEYVSKVFSDSGCKLISEEYVNNSLPLRYICICGEESTIAFASFIMGARCKKCAIKRITGENNYNYNPDISDDERIAKRDYLEYRKWRKSVYVRDEYTCKCCGVMGGKLEAHHLDGYNWCVERRTDVTNGVTLCEDCHNDFHSKYGLGDNTKEQYIEWLRNKDDSKFKASGF